LLPQFAFVDAPMFLAVVVIAALWGTGPALFAVLVSAVLLDYFVLPPVQVFGLHTGEGLLQLLPFLLAGVLIAVMTSQREQARQRAQHTQREMMMYVDEVTQINAKLGEADRLKDRFLSIVSHELKGPMTTILANVQLLQRRLVKRPDLLSNPDRLYQDLEKIEKQTNRMNALVDDLLDWSRIHAGKMQLHLSQCDPGAICRTVMEDQRLVTGRPIELELPLAPVLLQADQNRLSQVMTNLISNAVKYSPEEAPVRVAVKRNEQEAIISVADAGQGIAESQRTRIFELFYRTPEAQGSMESGLGLGLAISKQLVERHGGRIWCESVVGKGSTFFVSLPLSGHQEGAI
jgi:signal transduction histidine kinase